MLLLLTNSSMLDVLFVHSTSAVSKHNFSLYSCKLFELYIDFMDKQYCCEETVILYTWMLISMVSISTPMNFPQTENTPLLSVGLISNKTFLYWWVGRSCIDTRIPFSCSLAPLYLRHWDFIFLFPSAFLWTALK